MVLNYYLFNLLFFNLSGSLAPLVNINDHSNAALGCFGWVVFKKSVQVILKPQSCEDRAHCACKFIYLENVALWTATPNIIIIIIICLNVRLEHQQRSLYLCCTKLLSRANYLKANHLTR